MSLTETARSFHTSWEKVYQAVEYVVQWGLEHRQLGPICGARRMAEGAALLVDEVLPRQPMRQWVLSVPFALRYLFATAPAVMGQVLGIVYRAIASHLLQSSRP